jgi:hypothetical protein
VLHNQTLPQSSSNVTTVAKLEDGSESRFDRDEALSNDGSEALVIEEQAFLPVVPLDVRPTDLVRGKAGDQSRF